MIEFGVLAVARLVTDKVEFSVFGRRECYVERWFIPDFGDKADERSLTKLVNCG